MTAKFQSFLRHFVSLWIIILERVQNKMADQEKRSLEEKLRTIIETVDVANAMTEPLTESIKNLLYLSGRSMKSDEASVIVRDGDDGDLRFLSAIGQVADQLIGMKIPSGKGIAGFVFSSGQPMAVADVGQEESFYAEVDKTTGYSTQTILATPLRHNGEIIGVLEYVNRVGEPPYESFTPFEMDKAALFAEAIASLVNAYESAKVFRELGEKLLNRDEEVGLAEVRDWLKNLRSTAEHREMIDLALLVKEISSQGEPERTLCREIMESILRCSNDKSETSFLSY
jgi:signal transduction protein with GAF and PtsI domain